VAILINFDNVHPQTKITSNQPWQAGLQTEVFVKECDKFFSLKFDLPSIISGFEYDIFISYRQKDNKYDGFLWILCFSYGHAAGNRNRSQENFKRYSKEKDCRSSTAITGIVQVPFLIFDIGCESTERSCSIR